MAKKKRNRTILATLSDTHAGSKLGLMNPDVVLYDETPDGDLVPYTPNLTASQKYLWSWYQHCVKSVIDIADGDRICVLHIGDLTQGNKYPRALVSTRMADQVIIAVENLSVWTEIKNVELVRLSGGTGSHEFEETSASILVANTLNKQSDGKQDIKICEHGLLTVDGVDIDYAHHGPYPGSRVWLKGNVARYYLRDLMMREIMEGCKPPDLVLRAHYHTPVEEYLNIQGCQSWLYVLPSFTTLGIYDRQATRSVNMITSGMNVYEIENGKIEKKHFLHDKKDVRTKERI